MALAVFSFLKWEGRRIEEFSLFFGSKNPDGRDFGGYLDQMFCGDGSAGWTFSKGPFYWRFYAFFWYIGAANVFFLLSFV